MSTVNPIVREVSAKIVFYGPGLSGKTTSLRRVYESVKPAHRGEMISLATEGDRTLFFDFLPVKVEKVGDCVVRLALYTVPGQVFYNATRKHVLQGADGVVFVADSQPEAMDNNRESLANLEENLAEQGARIERLPLVFQWNKRDLAKALPVETLRAQLNPRALPEFETCATAGRGIFDSLKTITRLVIADLRSKRIVPMTRPTAQAQQGAGRGLESELQQHLTRPPSSQASPPQQPAPPPQAQPPAREAQRPREKPQPRAVRTLGTALTLAPPELADLAAALDQAMAAGDPGACVRAAQEVVRQALALAGEDAPVAAQAYFLRVDGDDVRRMLALSPEASRGEDAAFAYYVALHALVRAGAMQAATG